MQSRQFFFSNCYSQGRRRRGFRSFIATVLTLMIPDAVFAVDCAPYRFDGIDATVCRIDLRQDRLRMFHLDEKDRPLKYFSAVERLLKPANETLVFAMNAGMYHK